MTTKTLRKLAKEWMVGYRQAGTDMREDMLVALLTTVRREGAEEIAKICEQHGSTPGRELAETIRNLPTEPNRPEGECPHGCEDGKIKIKSKLSSDSGYWLCPIHSALQGKAE